MWVQPQFNALALEWAIKTIISSRNSTRRAHVRWNRSNTKIINITVKFLQYLYYFQSLFIPACQIQMFCHAPFKLCPHAQVTFPFSVSGALVQFRKQLVVIWWSLDITPTSESRNGFKWETNFGRLGYVALCHLTPKRNFCIRMQNWTKKGRNWSK